MKRIILAAALILCVGTHAYAADVNLAWDAVTGAAGYRLEISTDGGTTWSGTVDTGALTPDAQGSVSYTLTGVAETSLVLVRCGAYSSGGTITWRQEAGAWYDHRKRPLSAPAGTGVK